MNQALAKVAEGKQKIDELNNQKPAPLKQNLDKLEADKISFQTRLEQIRTVFGKPLKTSLNTFAEQIGITGDELVSKFRTHWDKERKLTDKYQILEDFLKQFDKAKLPKAFEAFAKEAQKQTLEPIDASNINDILLDAFGLPRTMSAIACKSFLQQQQDRYLAFFRESTVSLENDSIVKFSFEEFGDRRLPSTDEIPSILKHWQIIDDMTKRIKKSGIKKFVSFSRNTGIYGTDQKGYVRHSYQIKVLGEMNDIRNLINQFQNGYKDNRIYVVNDISMELLSDEILKIEGVTAGNAAAVHNNTGRQALPQLSVAEEQKKIDIEKLPYYARPGYAAPVLGAENLIKAEIDFDYIVYTSDELKPKSK